MMFYSTLFFISDCVAIRCELVYFSLRLVRNKQQHTLKTIQLQF